MQSPGTQAGLNFALGMVFGAKGTPWWLNAVAAAGSEAVVRSTQQTAPQLLPPEMRHQRTGEEILRDFAIITFGWWLGQLLRGSDPRA